MRIKTMIIIIFTLLLTVVIMQNADDVPFKFLFSNFYISKLVMMLTVAIIGFIIGVLIAIPGNPKYRPGQAEETNINKKPSDTLSDEDREYIN